MSWTENLKNLFYNVWNQKYIVVGLDCDSLCCAAIVQKVFPNVIVVALYDCTYLYQLQPGSKKEFQQRYESALWLDQDVLNGFLCIGQHLITGDCEEQIPFRNVNSFNPNEFFGQKFQHSFRQNDSMSKLRDDTDCRLSETKAKCPFSTAMLLLHFFNKHWKRNPQLDALLMHSDSVGYNMIHYPINCEAWRRLLFTEDSQINCLIKEMQSVYCDYWRPNCPFNCKCDRFGDCICEKCCSMCDCRTEQRRCMFQHLNLLNELAETMPNCLDAQSRTTKDQKAKSDVTLKIAYIRQFLQGSAEKNVCCRQTVSAVQTMFSGFQGIKIKDISSLNEFNAFFAFIYGIFQDDLTFEPFQYLELHIVSGATVLPIYYQWNPKKRNYETIVSTEKGKILLHDYLRAAKIFSYAILSAKSIRVTPRCGGIINLPT